MDVLTGDGMFTGFKIFSPPPPIGCILIFLFFLQPIRIIFIKNINYEYSLSYRIIYIFTITILLQYNYTIIQQRSNKQNFFFFFVRKKIMRIIFLRRFTVQIPGMSDDLKCVFITISCYLLMNALKSRPWLNGLTMLAIHGGAVL